jgi:hypothetical protein
MDGRFSTGRDEVSGMAERTGRRGGHDCMPKGAAA